MYEETSNSVDMRVTVTEIRGYESQMEDEKIGMLRYRGSKLGRVKELDLFPKLEDDYKETSSVGGTVSVICFFVIFGLIYAEIKYYLDSKFVFKFSPDTDFDAKLKINIDVTIAMPCANLGADILDSTNQNAFKFGQLEEEDTWFELDRQQRHHFENKRYFNSYLREEYHAIKDVLWRNNYKSSFNEVLPRTHKPKRPHDACRIHGSLILNKVSGNFHVTAGRSLHLPRGHIHFSAFMSDNDYNFTHRIDRFSFGDLSPGIVHPLEGDEYISKSGMTLIQYFIEVVPTRVETFLTNIDTYQYSVKELSRPIDHDKGSHGMPGIFFKYDMSALKVTVRQQRDHLGMFLARLCAIVGGVYVCSGFINSIIQFVCKIFMCKWGQRVLEKGNIHQPNLILTAEGNSVPLTVT